jgi:hypothetical protein
MLYLCTVDLVDYLHVQGTVVVMLVWQLDLKLSVQAVSITTKGVSKKLVHVQVYSIQQYVISTGYSGFLHQ